MSLRHLRPYRAFWIAGTVGRSVPAYLWLMVRGWLGRPADDAAWQEVHERAAARVDRMVAHLGGIPVKFAQIAGARGDLFPEPFVRRLRRYHDDATPRPSAELRPSLEEALGEPLETVFATFDEVPLAAASIAQVHRARLRGGADVVVKIQYPEISRIAPVDLSSARAMSHVVSWLSGSDFRGFVREITRFVALELDFPREADSMERAARETRALGFVRVPRLHRERCGPRVLVMEYLDGIPITRVEALRRAGHDPLDLARRVARLYATMIFERGFFHGDPHPGNLLVLPDGAIGLLDFGLCKELPPGFARVAARMVVSGMSGDGEGALAAAAELGFDVTGVDPAAGLGILGALFGGGGARVADVPGLLLGNPLRSVPPDIALVARTLILLNGLSHTLAPGQHPIQAELIRCLAPLLVSPGAGPAARSA